MKLQVKRRIVGLLVATAVCAGVAYTPTVAMADMRGQDISKWQGYIDVNRLDEFVVVKASGSDIGYYYTDPLYSRNARAVRASGRKLGHYYYNGYDDPVDAANRFVNGLVSYQSGDMLVYDAEEARFISPAKVMAWVQQVRARLGSNANVWVYMSSSVTFAYNWSAVAASGVQLWVARYGQNNGAYPGSPTVGYWSRWGVHQYTSQGRIAGVSGYLDMNVAKDGTFGNGQTTNIIVNPYTSTPASSTPHGTYLGYSVAQTQRLLNSKGYTLAIDDWYGSATRSAVRDYQSKHGLQVDGYAGTATQASLNGTVVTSRYATPHGTYLGYSVAQTQRLLRQHGYRLSVDGWYGSATRSTVKAFQRATGLQVDGYAGRATQARLRVFSNKKTARTYTIRSGDTLTGIARKLGVSVAHLQASNSISNINRIYAGRTLNY